MLCNIVLVLFR